MIINNRGIPQSFPEHRLEKKNSHSDTNWTKHNFCLRNQTLINYLHK